MAATPETPNFTPGLEPFVRRVGFVIKSALDDPLDLEALAGIRRLVTGDFVLNLETVIGWRRICVRLQILVIIGHADSLPDRHDVLPSTRSFAAEHGLFGSHYKYQSTKPLGGWDALSGRGRWLWRACRPSDGRRR